jgi:calcineurin-like phosphoesterase family protein
MIWFSADFHLGNKNIIKYCNRPFKSAEEMDSAIINNWNSVVGVNDEAYILGDFAFRNRIEYANRLSGEITFLCGDHDYETAFPIWIRKISRLKDEYENIRTIVLCHWSMRSWEKSHYASWHLFGHHHGRLEPYGLSFDVGVDTNNFYPYSLTDIENKMKTLKPIVDYRRVR